MSFVQGNSPNSTSQELPAPFLPMEIVELIIDKLVPEGRHPRVAYDELTSCSLVCRTWLHACQRRMFSHVETPAYDGVRAIPGQPPKEDKLIEVLNRNTSLLGNVRQVTYRTDNVYQQEGNEDASISILLRLPLVKRLSIHCARYTSFESANERGSNFRSLLMHCISTGNLSHLSVSAIDRLPMNEILSSPRLQCLVVRDCGFREKERSARYSPLKFLKIEGHKNMPWSIFQSCRDLETLIIGSSCEPPIADDCMVQEVFPSLKHFKLSAPHWEEHLATVNQIFAGVSHIEQMRIEISDVRGHFPKPFRLDIGGCERRSQSSLKILQLYFTASRSFWTFATMIPDMMSAIQGNNVLEELDIILHYQYRPRSIADEFTPTLDDWRRFTNIVTENPPSFPFLQRLSLQILVSEELNWGCGKVNQQELAAFEGALRCILQPIAHTPNFSFKTWGRAGFFTISLTQRVAWCELSAQSESDMLAKIQGRDALEKLDISLHYNIRRPVTPAVQELQHWLAPTLEAWTRFTSLLTDVNDPASQFPSLRHVYLQIIIDDRDTDAAHRPD
ncbi:hypothetical protein CVT24_011396 [Panaeolus cyanescens]|uniref:F-box domain-containing protein n=1 Tax=Panaeolus cyanescens TaxID=181874 RepID=A0A409YGK1_9AGAR|nr:hypothetical protein CVT24_011396 [Panaeolus cyanescens]